MKKHSDGKNPPAGPKKASGDSRATGDRHSTREGGAKKAGSPKRSRKAGGRTNTKRTKRKNTKKPNRIKPYYYALISISLLLVILLVTIPDKLDSRDYTRNPVRDQVAGTTTEDLASGRFDDGYDEAYEENVADDVVENVLEKASESDNMRDAPERDSGHPEESSPRGPSLDGVPQSESAVPERSGSMGSNSLAIVIDDVGNNLEQLDLFLEVPGSLTFAVLPGRRYSREAAERIVQAGKRVILHQPMEPLGDANPGDGALYVGMSKEQIYEVLDRNFADVPGATGMNNHMGSKVTAHEETMEFIFEYLSEREYTFIDSVTTGDTVGARMAQRFGVPYTRRSSMFLDNETEKEMIRAALETGLASVGSKSPTVLIGHVMSTELADLLIEYYPGMIDEGYRIEDVYALLAADGITVAENDAGESAGTEDDVYGEN